MEFFDREKELVYMQRILSQEPRNIIFIYGPINSGKTAFITRVLDQMESRKYAVFYFNLRGYQISRYDDILDIFFEIDDEAEGHDIKSYLSNITDVMAKLAENALFYATGLKIPVPKAVFDSIFKEKEKPRDAFNYIEVFFKKLVESGLRPIIAIDELQRMKGIKTNGEFIDDLFNFFVRLTKETHLSHAVAISSDCLFIEHVYGVSRLEGRARYFKIDDFDRHTAFRFYRFLGFPEDKFELIWDYLGGKIGDILALEQDFKAGFDIEEQLRIMLRDEQNRLKKVLKVAKVVPPAVVIRGEKKELSLRDIQALLVRFKERDEVDVDDVDEATLRFLVSENILFFDPLPGIVRPQSRLVHKAIKTMELRL